MWFPIVFDLSLALVALCIIVISRTKDTVTWWGILSFPAYWIGGAVLGHLIVLVGLKSLLEYVGVATSNVSTVLLLFCFLWGVLIAHIWTMLNE